MFLSACQKRCQPQRTEVVYKVDTFRITVPERKESLAVYLPELRKDTLIVKRDTIGKVQIRFVKIKDTVKVECTCDSVTLTKIDTVAYIRNVYRVRETNKRHIGDKMVLALCLFLVILLLLALWK
jgi:hypothetical protein